MKFRKKPIVIEAIQWTGKNWSEIKEFTQGRAERWTKNKLVIDTFKGPHYATLGDWIIKGIAGEFYPCKPGIFEATYGPTEDPCS